MTSRPQPAPVRQEAAEQWGRRIALFVGILMSGGLLLIPRLPLLGLLVVVFCFLRNPLLLIRREFSGIWLLLIAVLTASILGGGAIELSFIATRYSNFLGGLLLLGIYFTKQRGTFERDITPILRLFAIQALLTVFLAVMVPQLFRGYQSQGQTYESIFLIFTYHVMLDLPGLLPRPDGFFYEPGVLQFYLNLFLYITLFRIKRPRDTALALAGILATQSTTGLAIALMVLGTAVLSRLRTGHGSQKMIVALIAPIIVVPIAIVAYANFVDKTEGHSQGSAWSRQYDLHAGLGVVGEYPLAGIGFDPERYREVAQKHSAIETQLDAATLAERSNSNGILVLAYSLGIPLALVFLWGVFNQPILPDKMLITTLFIISFLTESHILTPFFLMFAFSGLLIKPAARTAYVAPRVPYH